MTTALTTQYNHSALVSAVLSNGAYESFINYVDAKPKTIETYRRNLKQFFSFLAERGITTPTREDVLAYRAFLIESGKKPTTVQNYLIVVRIFFDWAELQGVYPNIAKKVKGQKLERTYKKDAFAPSQVKAILKEFDRTTLTGARDYAVFALMVTCGLRTIEVSRANVEDLRAVGGVLKLFIQGKGRDDRAQFVAIPEGVQSAIYAYLKLRGAYAKGEPLFSSTSNNSAGQRLTTRSISGIAKTAMRRAGFDSDFYTAHSLRHTAATVAVESGMSVQDVQAFARHANIATTMIYVHMNEANKNRCSEVVGASFFD